jgi:DNA repair protein RadC
MKSTKFKIDETNGTYTVLTPVTEKDILTMANQLAKNRLAKGNVIERPSSAFIYLQTLKSQYEREVFGSIFLNTQYRIISFEELFYGTINAANIHPREVVKRALELNAAAIIFVHNHPSGDSSPSDADVQITIVLREALNLIDVRVLDHIVVGANECVSMTECGLI